MSTHHAVHFPPLSAVLQAVGGEIQRKEYSRPDIVLLGSIRAAAGAIAKELKVIGEEREYHGTLTVLITQSRAIHEHAAELLRRYEAQGEQTQ